MELQRAREIGEVPISEEPPFKLKDIVQYFPTAQYYSFSYGDYILDADGRTVILFKKDKTGLINSLYAPREKNELARLATGLAVEHPDVYQYFQSLFDLPNLNDSHFIEFEAIKRTNLQDQQKIDDAVSSSVEYEDINTDQDSIIGVLQGEYAISDQGNTKNKVASFGASPCLMIFIRRPEQIDFQRKVKVSARGAVAHFDALSTVESIGDMISKMPSHQPLEVSIISGGFDRQTFLKLLNYFENKNVVLKVDIGNGVDSAVMDIETGKMQKHIHPEDCGENKDLRMSLTSLKTTVQSLTCAYDGTGRSNVMPKNAIALAM